MPADQTEPYQQLIDRVQRLHAALQPHRGRDMLGQSDELDHVLLESLLAQLQHAHPVAGRRYWSARLWQLVTWQAVYLSVAASDTGVELTLGKLLQAVGSASICGFSSPPAAVIACRECSHSSIAPHRDRACLEYNARQLRLFVDRYFELINGVITLSKANSLGQVADTLHFALLSARGSRQQSEVVQMGRAWSKASRLLGRSGAPLSGFIQRKSQFVIARCSCCRHHLIEPGPEAFCEECPLLRKRDLAAAQPSHATPINLSKNKKVNYGNGYTEPPARH